MASNSIQIETVHLNHTTSGEDLGQLIAHRIPMLRYVAESSTTAS